MWTQELFEMSINRILNQHAPTGPLSQTTRRRRRYADIFIYKVYIWIQTPSALTQTHTHTQYLNTPPPLLTQANRRIIWKAKAFCMPTTACACVRRNSSVGGAVSIETIVFCIVMYVFLKCETVAWPLFCVLYGEHNINWSNNLCVQPKLHHLNFVTPVRRQRSRIHWKSNHATIHYILKPQVCSFLHIVSCICTYRLMKRKSLWSLH